jgi:site-specific DNA-methyltransferase (adenine-specific)
MNMIENVDCLDYLKTLSDDSVDMVLTDPPYFIGFDGGKGWDAQWKTEDEYLSWCDLWTKECLRVLKPNRMLIVWGTLKTETFIKYKLRTSEYLKDVYGGVPQNEIIWSYNWGGRSKTNFARKHEYAWCWSKGQEFLFNADDILVERKVKKNLRTGKPYEKGTIPTSVWTKNNHTASKDHIGWHPTTKNIEILERMVLAYTNKNDVVLDVFMGSGSTAVAALRAGRNYLGCEKDVEYFDKSNERIENILDNIEPVAAVSSLSEFFQ